jgi:predicted ATP-dependent protease
VPKQKPLNIAKLRNVYDPAKLEFKTTADLEQPGQEVMGQERALESLSFGLGMEGHDYNVYVAGPRESGRGYITQSLVKNQAAKESSPPDWVYVHNFKNPDAPKAILLNQGRAKEFGKDLTELIEDVKAEIPDIFESEDYSARRDKLVSVFNQKRTSLLQELEEKVKAEGFLINMSQVGMVIMPAKEDKPMEEADIAAMSDEDKEGLKEKSTALQTEMNQTVREIRKFEKGLKAQLKDLDKRIALFAVGHLIDELQEKYSDQKEVLHHLKDVKDDIILNIDDFKQRPAQQQASPFPMPTQEADLSRYQVNVLVDNSECVGAPVVVETNPSYANLFGSMERRAQFGALFTDFTMIRPGALHRANGGYLVINTLDLLKFWISYEALKRGLKNGEIKLEEPAEMYGMITTKGMKPEPIPLNIKVILVGDPMYYHLL